MLTVPCDVLVTLAALPLRVQQMAALLLLHQEAICRYQIGSVELHFHDESVKAKLSCQLAEPASP